MYTVYDYADRFIQKNKIDALPVDIKHIAKSLGNSVQRYSQGKKFIEALGLSDYADKYDSFSCYRNKKHYIFVRDGLSKQEEQQKIAHELGHIEMHMVGDSGRSLCGDTADQNMQRKWEQEADDFGLFIRAPLPLLCTLGIISPAEISKEADIPPKDGAVAAKNLSYYRVRLNTIRGELDTYKRHEKAYKRRVFRKMLYQIAGVASITLIICFGVFCLTASVFSGLVLPDLIGDSVSSVASSHEAPVRDHVSNVAESSAASPKPADQPPTETYEFPASSQVLTSSRTQPAAQQPQTHYTQPAAPSSSTLVYTPPASSTAPSSAAPPPPSSMSDVVPVKPKEPLITITPYTRYYWTGGGTKYHLFADCYHIRGSEYQIESGLLADAKAAGKDGLCADCSRRNKKG